MASEDPYSRLYWRLIDEYPDVWANDRLLASYARLLVIADAQWPASADRPASVPDAAWKALVSVGLVIPEARGQRFRIRGMDKMRNARSDSARNAANAKWRNADRNAVRNATAETRPMRIPSRAEPSHTEPSNEPPTPAERGQDGDDDGMPGGTPRSNGTNPRAVAAREAQRRRDLANDLQMRYLRGELTADQHRQARADAGLPS